MEKIKKAQNGKENKEGKMKAGILQTVHHGTKQILGTEWPDESFMERRGPRDYLVTYHLVNGVPSGAEKFRTRREAEAALSASEAGLEREEE